MKDDFISSFVLSMYFSTTLDANLWLYRETNFSLIFYINHMLCNIVSIWVLNHIIKVLVHEDYYWNAFFIVITKFCHNSFQLKY